MQNNNLIVMAIIAVLLSIFIYLMYRLENCHDKNILVYQKDTLIIYKPQMIEVEKIKAKIVYKRDTIFQIKPFIASADTIIQKDTVYIRYDFPENQFKFKISQATDTILVKKIYEYAQGYNDSWLIRVLIFVAGLTGGYYLF